MAIQGGVPMFPFDGFDKPTMCASCGATLETLSITRANYDPLTKELGPLEEVAVSGCPQCDGGSQ